MTRSNKNQDLTPAELYAVSLCNEEPNYYARIPAIIYHCTYFSDKNDKTTGKLKTIRKKLSPYAIVLYSYLKQVAGKRGFLWASRDHLAKMTGMSAGMITNAKRELSTAMEQLNGKSLIKIVKKQRKKFNPITQKMQSNEYDEVHIQNIWPENNAYMVTQEYQEELELGDVDNLASRSNSDHEPSSKSNGDRSPQEARSPHGTNKNQIRKNHSDKELESSASPPNLNLSTSKISDSNISHTSQISDDRCRMKDILLKSGCDENFIKDMFKQFSDTQIKEACKTLRQVMEKKKLDNPCGYLRKILKTIKK